MATRKPNPMREWGERNGESTKDHAAPRNRPSAQAQPVLLRKLEWPVSEPVPVFKDEWLMTGVYDPSIEPGQPLALLCNRCMGKHVGHTCPTERPRHKRKARRSHRGRDK